MRLFSVHECDHCGKSFFNYYHINQHFCESLKQVTQPSKSKNNDHTENLGCLNWYKSFKNYLKRKEEEQKAYESGLSEYEKIRLEKITERQRIFNELQLGDLSSDLSLKKLNVKDEIWNKLCIFVNKKDEFSEDEMEKFFKTVSGPKSTPSQIENNLRNVAKMYYLKTEQDFFKAFPNILKVIEDLKNDCEPPKQGTKRTQGKDEEIWKDFCTYTGKTKDFEENEVTEFLKKSTSQRNLPMDVKDQKLRNYKKSITTIYYLKTKRNFDMDFPNVQQFVEEGTEIPNLKMHIKNVHEDPKDL